MLHATAYGCAASGPGAVALGSTDGLCPRTPQAGPVALGATIAAYALRTCGIDLATAQIVVRSLATGRRIATLDALTVEVGAEAFESVGSVAVRADGDCAWIARSDSIAGHHRITEVVSRARGATHELGAGAAIAIGSLRLSGSRLTWRDGRRVRAAVLS
ncbi:MAG: hypothetical protein ABSH51_01080 [Solirubrobacteraceae bacterium]